MFDSSEQELNSVSEDWADKLIQLEPPDPRFALKFDSGPTYLQTISEEKDTTTKSRRDVPLETFSEQMSGCGRTEAKPREEDSSSEGAVQFEAPFADNTRQDQILILGTSQYRLIGASLLSFEQAESIYSRLNNTEPGDLLAEHRKRSSPWSMEETCLLQWTVFVYCDQKVAAPPQFVSSPYL